MAVVPVLIGIDHVINQDSGTLVWWVWVWVCTRNLCNDAAGRTGKLPWFRWVL